MKIRTVERDDRSKIRQCEECKESGKDGVMLVLGFFNGFVCTDCEGRLAGALDGALRLNNDYGPDFDVPTKLVEAKTRKAFEEYSPDGRSCDSQPRTATFSNNWTDSVDSRLTALESRLEREVGRIDQLDKATHCRMLEMLGMGDRFIKLEQQIEKIQHATHSLEILGENR